MIPGHDQRRRPAGAAARRRALGILRQRHVVLLLDDRQHFAFDELGVAARHRVVLEAALAALGVAAAVADGDRNHRGHTFLSDQIVERREQELVRSIGSDDEGSSGARNVLFRHVHGNAASVGGRVARRYDEFRGVRGIDGAERSGVTGDAGINLAVGRAHREVVDRSLGHAVLHRHFRRWVVRRADDEVSVCIGGRKGPVRQLLAVT